MSDVSKRGCRRSTQSRENKAPTLQSGTLMLPDGRDQAPLVATAPSTSQGATAVNGSPERVNLSLEAQLLEQCCKFEDAIAARAIDMPSHMAEGFAEHAIEELLVVFAQHTRGPGGPPASTWPSAHTSEKGFGAGWTTCEIYRSE
jgi:hypothetical protein